MSASTWAACRARCRDRARCRGRSRGFRPAPAPDGRSRRPRRCCGAGAAEGGAVAPSGSWLRGLPRDPVRAGEGLDITATHDPVRSGRAPTGGGGGIGRLKGDGFDGSHGDDVSRGSMTRASRFLIGRVSAGPEYARRRRRSVIRCCYRLRHHLIFHRKTVCSMAYRRCHHHRPVHHPPDPGLIQEGKELFIPSSPDGPCPRSSWPPSCREITAGDSGRQSPMVCL